MNSLHAKRDALLVHGKEPAFLIEKIIRERIFESVFWKERCFSLNYYTLLEYTCFEVAYVGGVYANQRPVPFFALLLKLLQINPPVSAVVEALKVREFKYLRCLALFYVRIVAPPANVYRILEPFLLDWSRVRMRAESGEFCVTHIDEFVDWLLHDDRVFGVVLPRLTKRHVLEQTGLLDVRISPVEYEMEEEMALKETEDISAHQTSQSDASKNNSEDVLLSSGGSEDEEVNAEIRRKLAKGRLAFKAPAAGTEASIPEAEDPAAAVRAEKKAARQQVNDSLSLEATNAARKSVGLKPLRRYAQ